MSPRIVSLNAPMEPEPMAPAADRVLDGNPQQQVYNYFTDSTQQFFAGRWSSTPGKWRVRYSENELCHLLSGRVRISDTAGRLREFGQGDSFVIPAGFEGTWEVLEDCIKLYAIFEASAPR
jgi:uncharacterized protein